jgi:hypothetical protein
MELLQNLIVLNYKQYINDLTNLSKYQDRQKAAAQIKSYNKYVEELNIIEFAKLGINSDISSSTNQRFLEPFIRTFRDKLLQKIDENIKGLSLMEAYKSILQEIESLLELNLFISTITKNLMTQLIISLFINRQDEEIIEFCKDESLVIYTQLKSFIESAKSFYNQQLVSNPFLLVNLNILNKL